MSVADNKATAKKKRSTAKGKFHRVFNRLLSGSNNDEDFDVLGSMLQDLEIGFKDIEEKHDAYMDVLDSADEDDRSCIADINSDMDQLYDELCKCRSLIKKRDVVKGIKKDVPRNLPIQIKKLDAPSFGGTIREYPSFKQDFKTHMLPIYGTDPYALKTCLTKDALLTIQGVDNDFEEMMKRLDAKYGRPEKLIDEVLGELNALKPVAEDDIAKFIDLVGIIEKCWLDMKRLGLEREMSSITVVSQIEKLLPATQLLEWAKIKLQLRVSDSETQFGKLLEYLLKEKEAMDYIQSEVRKTCSNRSVKSKINSILKESESNNEDTGVDERFKHQMEQNEMLMKKLVEGLSQVVQAVSKPTGNISKQNPQYGQRKRCWYHDVDNHMISECSDFISLSVGERINQVKRVGGCFCCLGVGHIVRNCFKKRQCDVFDGNSRRCGRFHHLLLHEDRNGRNDGRFHEDRNGRNDGRFHEDRNGRNDGRFQVNSVKLQRNTGEPLLMISSVKCHGQPLTTLCDSGSNVSLITKESARSLGLKGTPVTLRITKSGNVTDVGESFEYVIPLTDLQNKVWYITVYEMGEITAEVNQKDLSRVASLFDNISADDIQRPSGKVNLLVGTDCCTIFPNKISQVGNLQLMENQFGYCIRGAHPFLQNSGESYHCRLSHLSQIVVNNNDTHDIMKSSRLGKMIEDFFSIENLGTSNIPVQLPKCGGCKCGACLLGGSYYTPQEERELKLIEDGLTLDRVNKIWSVVYPWVKDSSMLPNNYKAVFSRLRSTEKRLKGAGMQYAQKYHEQIMDMLNRDVARKLTTKEIYNYEGPVHYIPHKEIIKPNSKSTPVRIVFNSSASYMGHTLNDYWAKGPCVINNLLVVLMRFRRNNVAMVADLSKMYNTIRLSLADQHTHRFLWRALNNSQNPDHYVLQTVPFGDRPSGTIATVALRKTADLFHDKFPDEVKLLKRDCYVDDILGSAESREEAESRIRNIEEILREGGFKVKQWVLSGVSEGDIKMSVEEEKVLGMRWDPKGDMFRFIVKLNFSPTQEIMGTGEDREKMRTTDVVPEMLTRRMVLGQISSLFDPLGLVIPVTLEAKVLMRRICTLNNKQCIEGNGWDQPIGEDLRVECINMIRNLLEIESLRFRRCIRPWDTLQDPVMVIFSDGSEVAYGCCVYIRWQTDHNAYESNLLVAKNRIAPQKKITIPRVELCGAVIAARLRDTIVRELDLPLAQILHLTDSSIVRAQIQKESHGFSNFVAVRIGEIQRKTDPSEWWWVPTEFNPADMTTRIKLAGNLGLGSMWQCGPEFMKRRIEEWPISKDCSISHKDLPDRVNVSLATDVRVFPGEKLIGVDLSDIKIEKFNNFEKLIAVTAMLVKIAVSKSFKNGSKIDTLGLLEAENLWIDYVQIDLKKANWKYKFRRLGPAVNKSGQIVVGKRMSEWLKDDWNQDSFILLPNKSRYSWLYAKCIHDKDHASPEVTLAKIRSKYWIPRCKPMISSIKASCVTCRGRDLKVIEQEMGTLPNERLKPSPPFAHCSVDLFGPFVIRDSVKKRSRGKAYGVIFTDLASRACYIDLAEGYDTNSFINVLRRFTSIRGFPKTMLSDGGSQLVAASKELREIVSSWDWNTIYQFGKTMGMQWKITKAADAPWENGCCEAMIKSTKRNIHLSVGSHILTFSELQTILFEISNLLNERPIGTKTNDPNEGTYLCPNDLILGRASARVPSECMENLNDTKKRWQFIQQVANTFWRKWQRDFFHTLLIRPKWHTSQRNLRVGDLVLVQDRNAVRGKWKLAQVAEVEQGKDGLVRDVCIRYKNQSPDKQYKGQQDVNVNRSVHRLVLLLPVEEQ